MQGLSKKKYNAIKRYLEKNISFEDYKGSDLWKGIHHRNKFQAGVYVFEREYGHNFNRFKYQRMNIIMSEYLRGLPSWLDIPFCYNDIDEFYKTFELRVSNRMYNEYWHIVAHILYEEGIKVNVNK